MFYPNIKQIKFKKNWYGKVIGIEYQDKKLSLQKYKENYRKLQEIAQKKLLITNQIYEISRIQFILQSFVSRKQMAYSHFIGIKETNFIENSIIDDSQIENFNDLSRIKETRIVQIHYIQQPQNETRMDISSYQLTHNPSNPTVNATSENEASIQNTAHVSLPPIDQKYYELSEEDFELLIVKQRQKPNIMSQFYELNKIY
ncbi:hypothetical protein FGO68_gene17256 [Halteria grandinella]|uniref:Uncharacterized protein n=1 Tax=Halteria grandinella TaxID=5974 RepID=A0A8J8NGE8_HALGN|nr:hypothetical protein FGO68_gene17256 [Halteria grandinella]